MIVLTQILMDTSIFFINVKNVSEIMLIKGDWVSTDDLTPEFFEDLKSNKYKVAFVKHENIFSHGMNVLRKILLGTDTIVVVGVEKIFDILWNSDKCKVNITDNIITIGDKVYKFRNFSFLRDTSETIEYNMDTEEICYKPDYYYNSELRSIIVKGYNMTSTMLPSSHSSRCDNEGRVWNKGFIFPYQFFDYFSFHLNEYYNNLLKYITVLEKIFSLRHLKKSSDELKYALANHYSYSTIFSFITPNISEVLKDTLGNDGLEKIYNFFVKNSPIHSKENLTDMSLEKMKVFLINIINGINNKENYFNVYYAYDMPSNDITLMYFVTNMFSDIRRCVINVIIENNPWFSSICQHRKRVKIY